MREIWLWELGDISLGFKCFTKLGVWLAWEEILWVELKIIFEWENFFQNRLIQCRFHLYSHICDFWGKTQISSCVDSRRSQDQAWYRLQVCSKRRKWTIKVWRSHENGLGKDWRLGLDKSLYSIIFLHKGCFLLLGGSWFFFISLEVFHAKILMSISLYLSLSLSFNILS